MESYAADFEKGLLREDKVADAFNSFAVTYSRYETLLNEWQRVFPKSFAPYLAQAKYYQEVGWPKRGHDWARNTRGMGKIS